MASAENSSSSNPGHCAFCLGIIPKDKKSLCGKCQRRVYCSRDCQIADWSTKGQGQGHKNWCGLECGEEDIDWEVAPVPGKGLGLIAKRPLPAKYRIIVDACRPENHPSIQDLMPDDGTVEEKFDLNCLPCDAVDEEDAGMSVICLRIARANHNCDPNAGHVYDKTAKVKILFAERDIKEGEEICISYESFKDIDKDESMSLAESCRELLKSKWKIDCPDDCFCRDKSIEKVVLKSRKLDASIATLASKGKTNEALDCVKTLLENHETIHSSWIEKKRTLYDGFQIAIMKKKTIKIGERYIKQLCDIMAAIRYPKSERLLEYQGWMNDPRTYHTYLMSV